jgi:hypothetical protein
VFPLTHLCFKASSEDSVQVLFQSRGKLTKSVLAGMLLPFLVDR